MKTETTTMTTTQWNSFAQTIPATAEVVEQDGLVQVYAVSRKTKERTLVIKAEHTHDHVWEVTAPVGLVAKKGA